MAFTGTPTKTLLGGLITKITGITLAAGASGTISNASGGGDIELGSTAPEIDADDTMVHIEGDEMTYSSISAGVITVTNGDSLNASRNLVIWVRKLHSIIQ